MPVEEHNDESAAEDGGGLIWLERRDGAIVRHEVEPGTRWWQRAWIRMLSALPIEWML